MSAIRVIRKNPGEHARVDIIQNELKPLQDAVGGHLESVTLWDGAVALCDEEGRIKGLPHNCRIGLRSFVGPILIVGTHGEEFCSLNAHQIRDYLRELA